MWGRVINPQKIIEEAQFFHPGGASSGGTVLAKSELSKPTLA
jgi:hypothetical protein